MVLYFVLRIVHILCMRENPIYVCSVALRRKKGGFPRRVTANLFSGLIELVHLRSGLPLLSIPLGSLKRVAASGTSLSLQTWDGKRYDLQFTSVFWTALLGELATSIGSGGRRVRKWKEELELQGVPVTDYQEL